MILRSAVLVINEPVFSVEYFVSYLIGETIPVGYLITKIGIGI